MAKKRVPRWRQVTTIHSFKNSKVVRVFGIARVSTDKQAKKIGESLDHQKKVLRDWVTSKSSLHSPQIWKLIDVYVENEGADGKRKGKTATKKEGREGLAKALEMAQHGLIDVVVITKLDRIARNVADYIEISAQFNESEVALVCLDLDIDTSTPDGQMIMRNHANLAQWQAERIAQYSIETVKRHLEQGRPIGPPPLGYKRAKDSNDKTSFTPDFVYMKHVKFIDKTYLTEKSVTKVVQILHKRGYKTPSKKTYSKPQVSRILQNIRYTARQEHEGNIYNGNWEPIRTRETYELINNILKKNRQHNCKSTVANKKYVYLAQSVLKCSICGSAMVARPATGRGGKYYPYYMCMKGYKTHGIDCEMTYLAAEAVDNALVEILRKLKLEPKTVANIVKDANSATATTLMEIEKDLNRVQSTLKDVRTQISNIVDVLASKGMSGIDAIKDRLENLNCEEEELKVEENRLQQEIQVEKIQAGTAHEYINTLQLFNDFYEMNRDNMERVQMLIPKLINSVICYITDKKIGVGKLKIGLFGRPFCNGENSEVWNETLTRIADEFYNKKVNEEIESKFASKPQRSSKRLALKKDSKVATFTTSKKLKGDSSFGFAQGNNSDPIFVPQAK